MTGFKASLNAALKNQAASSVPTAFSLILDRSGSMAPYISQIDTSVKSLIAEQSKVKGSCIFSLSQFDDQFDVVFKNRDIREVNPEEYSYNIRGGTAFRDAFVKGIEGMDGYLKEVKSKDQPAPKKIVIALITDGLDTHSYSTVEKVKNMISEKLKAGWTFFMLGADGNTLDIANELGIPKETSAVYSISHPEIAVKVLNALLTDGRKGRGNLQITAAQRETLALGSGEEKKEL